MADPRDEVVAIAKALHESLQPIAEKNPDKVVSAVEFNRVLELAQKAFPDSSAIKGMKPEGGAVKTSNLVMRVAALKAAAVAARQM